MFECTYCKSIRCVTYSKHLHKGHRHHEHNENIKITDTRDARRFASLIRHSVVGFVSTFPHEKCVVAVVDVVVVSESAPLLKTDWNCHESRVCTLHSLLFLQKFIDLFELREREKYENKDDIPIEFRPIDHSHTLLFLFFLFHETIHHSFCVVFISFILAQVLCNRPDMINIVIRVAIVDAYVVTDVVVFVIADVAVTALSLMPMPCYLDMHWKQKKKKTVQSIDHNAHNAHVLNAPFAWRTYRHIKRTKQGESCMCNLFVY